MKTPKPPDKGWNIPGVNLDASDLSELRQCSADKCAIRLSTHALSRFQAMAWDAPDAAAQPVASGVVVDEAGVERVGDCP